MSIEPCHQNRKDTSTGSDWAGAAGNFSESSGGGTRRERPGRPKRTPARRCAGPGPADAPFRSGGGGTGEGAPPPAGPAALSPTAEPRHRLPQTPADHSAHAPGTPPVPNTAGAWRCRSCSWRKLGQGTRGRPGSRPLGHSQARRVPTPRRPPPLLARWSAGLAGKESERETALAEAWPVPAPRPPSPCRRERAGSAGPLG